MLSFKKYQKVSVFYSTRCFDITIEALTLVNGDVTFEYLHGGDVVNYSVQY